MIYYLLLEGHLHPVGDCNMDGVKVKAVQHAEGEQREYPSTMQEKTLLRWKKLKVNKLKGFKLVSKYTKYLNIRIHPY